SVTSSSFAQCDPDFQRCTLNAIPFNNQLLKRTRLPLSIILEPYPTKEVPLITNGVLDKCHKCKSFINPFIGFSENGLRWKCNICGFDENNVPPSYDWDSTKQCNMDRWNRPELNHGCVDYLATVDYISRPPPPPTYLFVLDISFEAVQTGMHQALAEALLESIDKIPNQDGRAQIGFMTVHHALGFYNLSNKQPELLMVSPDIDDLYLPLPLSHLIVNLNESRHIVLDLLGRLPQMFHQSTSSSNCLGYALLAAKKLLSPTGGKIIGLMGSLCNSGIGSRTKTTNDKLLLEPLSDFYNSFAEECIKSHVSADMFVFGNRNTDVATLSVIPKFTGGRTYCYPGFDGRMEGDRNRLKYEMVNLLKEEVGSEAILRTKCSSGLICKSYHGNFLLQPPDILILPNVPRDGSYCIDLSIEKELTNDLVYIQTCMLYTTIRGERCIRVMTSCVPVTRKIIDVFYSADQLAIVRALSHQALEKSSSIRKKEGKDYLVQQMTSIFNAYSKEIVGSVPSKTQQLTISRSLSLLSVMLLGLIKSEAFSDLDAVPVNMISQSALLLRSLPSQLWPKYVYPRLYSLHNMPIKAGTLDSNHNCVMPPTLNLSSERLERYGCYLLENGQRILIFLGKEAIPQLCKDLLNVSNINEVETGQVTSLPIIDNQFSRKVNCIIDHLRTSSRYNHYYPSLYIVKEDSDPFLYSWFMTHIIEDKLHSQRAWSKSKEPYSTMSYFQWINLIKEKCF
ncbi:hypothetical protein BDB01DRAFT_713526, partial [Pilobolus umbonatus]